MITTKGRGLLAVLMLAELCSIIGGCQTFIKETAERSPSRDHSMIRSSEEMYSFFLPKLIKENKTHLNPELAKKGRRGFVPKLWDVGTRNSPMDDYVLKDLVNRYIAVLVQQL